MRIRAATAVGSGASLIAGIAVPIAFPHVDPWIGKALLVAALALFALAVGLYWPHRLGSGGDGTSITTGGPNSPGFGHVQGDVNNYYGPPPEKPKKSGYDWKNVDRLTRVMEGGSGFQADDLRIQGRAARRGVPEPTPDVVLNYVLAPVYKALGPVPPNNLDKVKFWRKVDLAVVDQVAIKRLHVWGRVGKTALRPIDEGDWKHGSLDHKSGTLTVPNDDWMMHDRPTVYTDLHFNREEIDRIWPR